jgi:hypothetical protein
MLEVDSLVTGSTKYPMDESLKLGGSNFFGMTPCYAVALALLQGYKHIELWGVELSATEYQYGIDSWMFWVGFAKGMLGTDHFILHSGEKLFTAPLYGIEGGTQFEADFFSNRITFLDNGWNAAEKHLKNIKALFEKYIENNEYEKVIDLFKEYEKSALEAGEFAGALSECEKWNGIENWIIDRNMFEMAAAKAEQEGDDKRTLMLHNGGMVEYVWNVWKQTGDKKAAIQFTKFLELHGKLAYDTGAFHGVVIEDKSYMMKYDDMMLANGITSKPATPAVQAVLRHE